MASDDSSGWALSGEDLWLYLSSLLEPVDTAFRHHPLLTNTLVSGMLLVMGDLIVQAVENRRRRSSSRRRHSGYFSARTLRMWIVGCVIGIFSHFWYGILEHLVEGEGQTMVVKKILWDQAIAGPFFSSVFLVGMGILEWREAGDIWDEWKDKFPRIYLADWKVWPLAQFINFNFVPLRYRVLYVNLITLCWDTYLASTKHEKNGH